MVNEGGAVGEAKASNNSLTLSSKSPLAGGKWLHVFAKNNFPVMGGEEVTLSVNAEAVGTGRAFVGVAFAPSGGDSRLYLLSGTYGAKDFAETFEVPPGAKNAHVFFGVESKTQSLVINRASVERAAGSRSNLPAHWLPSKPNHVFPQAPGSVSDIVALDLAKLSDDEVFLATTVQGLVNRTQPRIYLYHADYDHFWAKWLLDQRFVHSIEDVPDLASLLARFPKEINGVIAYDRALPASLHAAMMIGAIKGYPATSAGVAAKYGLRVEENLTGRWKRNVDAYRELWTKYRGQFTPRVLAVHYPFMKQQGPRDYLVQQKIFTFWVSGYADNDPGGDPAAEMNFAHEVLAETPPNIPIMGWWSFGQDQGISEYEAVKLSSSYAKFLAGSEYSANLSILSGLAVPAEVFKQRPTPSVPSLGDQLAATLSVLDSGDSLWYWQRYQSKLWQDPARGRSPINWSLNPTALDVMPAVLAWFYRQATPNDLFFCALSGLGYMAPKSYGSRFKAEDRERIWREYLSQLAVYLKALDLPLVELYAGAWNEPRDGMDPIYKRFFQNIPELQGILSDFGRHEGTTPENAIEIIEGRPVFHTQMRWISWVTPDEVASQLKQEEKSVDFTLQEFLQNEPKARPGFMSGLILSWTMSPTLVERLAAKLPPDVKLMNADSLVKEFNSSRKNVPK